MDPKDQLPNTIGGVLSEGLAALPAAVSKSAVGAVLRLVAGTVEIPATWLAGFKEAIEDANYEKRLLRRGLAEAATQRAVADGALVQRTVDRLITEETRRQSNRESIAKAALQELSSLPSGNAEGSEALSVDEDWLGIYSRHAENVSSEQAQRLWGRVLAG